MILSGWGNFPRIHCRVAEFDSARLDAPLIARGAGRSYGDASLQPNLTLLTRRLDRLLAFDAATGRLTCEAGVTLANLLDVFVPRGWFPPVTPGTKHVTIGGMVAADVHGKNHHVAGSFGRHVESLRMLLADGGVVECGNGSDLFRATIGGMGLTGIILAATFRLQPIPTPWIRREVVRAASLEATLEAFEASAGWTYTVSWIDCLNGRGRLGRSLLSRGEFAQPDEAPTTPPPATRPRRVPVDFPGWVLNRWSMRAFNELYYALPREPAVVPYEPFFYPLDGLLEWNRIYGRGGFTQYQCVLPKPAGAAGLLRLLKAIQQSGSGSFLAVLKLFGRQDGLMSFPMEGYTLALDFPVTPPNLSLLIELDAIVADHGGRIYLAKDSRASPAAIRRGYPGLAEFQSIRDGVGARGRMQSLLAERLDL